MFGAVWVHATTSLKATFPVRMSEWGLAGMMLACAAVLLVNTNLFMEFEKAYSVLADVATQRTWGILLLIGGSTRVIMLCVNGMWRRSPFLRALGAYMACGFWFSISYGFIMAGTFGLVTALVPFLLLMDSYNAVRAVGEAAEAGENYKKLKRDAGHARSHSVNSV